MVKGGMQVVGTNPSLRAQRINDSDRDASIFLQERQQVDRGCFIVTGLWRFLLPLRWLAQKTL